MEIPIRSSYKLNFATRKPQTCQLQYPFSHLLRPIAPQLLFSLVCFLHFMICAASISYGQETREEEVKFNIPYELLAGDRREEVREIVASHTTFRVFHDIEFKTNESVLTFMMDHPVFLSGTLKAMKIKDYFVKSTDNGMYIFDDRKGVSGKFEVIFFRPGQRYYYGFGGYYALFLKLVGRGAVLFEYRGVKGNPPRTYINVNVFTKVDNIVLDFLLKILKPIIIPWMDKKIYRFIEVTQKLANEITMHPEKVYRVVEESGDVDKEELEEFRKLIF